MSLASQMSREPWTKQGSVIISLDKRPGLVTHLIINFGYLATISMLQHESEQTDGIIMYLSGDKS